MDNTLRYHLIESSKLKDRDIIIYDMRNGVKIEMLYHSCGNEIDIDKLSKWLDMNVTHYGDSPMQHTIEIGINLDKE